ncbi:MAG: hypothetical protein GXO62_03145 [Epsilonproteobacteria bacterium]|nr:hypothetical protein [Campylobacterota bacterium]
MEVPKHHAYYNGEFYKLLPLEFNKLERFLAEREYQQNYTKLQKLPFFHNSMPVIYSLFSDTQLFIKDNNLEVLGKTEYFIKKYTKKYLLALFPDILEVSAAIYDSYYDEELEDLIPLSNAIKTYLEYKNII